MKRDKDGYIILEEAYEGMCEYEMALQKLNAVLPTERQARKQKARTDEVIRRSQEYRRKRRETQSICDYGFTADDYEPGMMKFNIGDHEIEHVTPTGPKKIKSLKDLIPDIKGSTFEIGKRCFEWTIYYE